MSKSFIFSIVFLLLMILFGILSISSASGEWKENLQVEFKEQIEKKLLEVSNIKPSDKIILKFLENNSKDQVDNVLDLRACAEKLDNLGNKINTIRKNCVFLGSAKSGDTFTILISNVISLLAANVKKESFNDSNEFIFEGFYLAVRMHTSLSSTVEIKLSNKYSDYTPRLLNTPYIEKVAFGFISKDEGPYIATASIEINQGIESNAPVETIYPLENTSLTVYESVINDIKNGKTIDPLVMLSCNIFCIPAVPYFIYKSYADKGEIKKLKKIAKLLREAEITKGETLEEFATDIIKEHPEFTIERISLLLQHGNNKLSFINAKWKLPSLGNKVREITHLDSIEEIKDKILNGSL